MDSRQIADLYYDGWIAQRGELSAVPLAEILSTLGNALADHSWLPTSVGAYARPGALSLDDLPVDYFRDDGLARALGMIVSDVEEASRATGLSESAVRKLNQLQQHDPEAAQRVERLIEQLTMESVLAEHDDESHVEEHARDDLDYGTELSAVFERPSWSRGAPDDQGDGAVANPDHRRTRVREAIAASRAVERDPRDRFRDVPRRVWEAKDSATRAFITEQYGGVCQICGASFDRRDGHPYFDAVYLIARTRADWIDRPGNVLSLCPTCRAKLQNGSVEADDVVEQVLSWRTEREGGTGEPMIQICLCGDDAQIRYTERHLLDLQEMVRTEVDPKTSGQKSSS
jgi:hypothetical protein